MPQHKGSAAVPSTPQSADETLTPDEVRRLDRVEYAEACATARDAARRILTAGLPSEPTAESATLARELAAAGNRLRSAAEWLIASSAEGTPQ